MARGATHTAVDETRFFHLLRTIHISEIDEDRTCHEVPHPCEVEGTELFPLGDDHGSVRVLHAMVWSLTKHHIRQGMLGLLHSHRVRAEHPRHPSGPGS